MIKTSAIILAAGYSKRASTDKQFYNLNGRYLIEITLSKFLSADINEIIIALSPENLKKYSEIFSKYGVKLAEGGKTRIESLIKSSKYISGDSSVVIVHDGARPFVSTDLINKIISASNSYGCAVPVIPLKDTIKEVDTDNQKIIKTIERKKHFAVQTPQGYIKEIFDRIINSVKDFEVTDDSQIAESLGIEVKVIPGEETNIKITTPLDLMIAEVIYEKTQIKL